jgi:hypothetical protein
VGGDLSQACEMKMKVEGQRDGVQLIDKDGNVLWEIEMLCKFKSVESLYMCLYN